MPDPEIKVAARNLTARAAADAPPLAAGNSMATMLQSGVGNCYPGLECDIRNLERRFFPFLEMDLAGDNGLVTAVDIEGVEAARQAGILEDSDAAAYRLISDNLGSGWFMERLRGDFGPLGMLDVTRAQLAATTTSIGPGRLPPDAWTAVRLLKEGSLVTLTLRSDAGTVTLAGNRAAYLDPTGALARIFEVGELTQSLCSPWTHDFRDCLCFYWASNHPDIALPPRPGAADPADPKWGLETHWERADRSLDNPPVETIFGGNQPGDGSGVTEMQYHDINRDWQKLNFVLERREQLLPYVERPFEADALADMAALIEHLRFAAGVEIAVMQEYLVAWASLRPADTTSEPVRSDLRAATAELLRIAIGEMRHLRAVNAVLRAISPAGQYTPALQVASAIPTGPSETRPLALRPLTAQAIIDFIEVEAPSDGADSLYARILVTLKELGLPDQQQQAIRTVMAEGEEHWQTFIFIQQWLGRHPEPAYLRSANLAPAPAGNPAQAALDQRYADLLGQLHEAYEIGLPAGAPQLNAARAAMLGDNGIEGAIRAVATAGFLPIFRVSADPRFSPIDPPPE